MRKYDIENPYEKLKDFTRGKATVNKAEYQEFVENLEGLPAEEKQRMKELTPATYTGYASHFAKNVNKYK
jgi:adenylosuccinate lyase